MTDRIGVLGEATTLTGSATTTTVYTVPSDKAARFKIMYRIQGNSDASTDLDITVNGIVVLTHTNIGASQYLYSSIAAMKEGSTATVPAGDTDSTTVAPGPAEYFLSAGDTLTYTLGGSNALAVSVQAVGVEIDV